MNNLPKYFDTAATTPVDKRVLDAMYPYFSEIFGNASSSHIYGIQAKEAIDKARVQVATLINADNREIIFTSGATESNNIAIKGAALYQKEAENRDHAITLLTEHKCVIESYRWLEKNGFKVNF